MKEVSASMMRLRSRHNQLTLLSQHQEELPREARILCFIGGSLGLCGGCIVNTPETMDTQ